MTILPSGFHPQNWSSNFVLAFSMFIVGICGICYEYTFSKLASDILGNTAQQWAIVIGLMMFFMGIGADLQTYFPDKHNMEQFILLQVILGALGGFGPSLILYSFGAIHDHFVLIHYFLISAIGILVGLEIPLMIRINQKLNPKLKENLGMILKLDYIGAFVGAFVWIFVLPYYLTLIEMAYFIGLLNLIVSFFTWIYFYPSIRNRIYLPVLIFLVSISLFLGIFNGKTISLYAEQKLYQDPIVFSKTTKYQHIVITQRHNGDIYTYINGNLQFSSVDEHIYHEMLVHPVMAVAAHKKRVLILGGGDGLAAREILKYKSVESITLVDLDSEMIRLARKHPLLVQLNENSLNQTKVKFPEIKGVYEGEQGKLNLKGRSFFLRDRDYDQVKVSIFNIDAFKFVQSFSGLFDIIIIDFPDPNHLGLSKLYTFEFYTFLKKQLAIDGLLIQQATSPTSAKDAFLIVGRTLAEAGFTSVPLHHHVPSFGDWGWWIAGHEEYYPPKFLEKKLKTVESIPVSTKYLSPELIKSSYFFGKNVLNTKHQDINKVLQDRIYFYYQKAWMDRE